MMADEVTSHNDEIMSICIRFVDKNKNTREEFPKFIPLERITGEQLAKELVTFYEYSTLICRISGDSAMIALQTCRLEKRA